MDKIIEDLLADFVIKSSQRFKLSFEDALAAVSQSKVANNLVEFGKPNNCSNEDLYQELFDEISKGY